MTQVKICGVCRLVDAQAVAAADADYIGVILAQRGPRQQSLAAAADIFSAAGDLNRVAVFADQDVMEVAAAAQKLELDVLQLHGVESAQFINELECESDAAIWKVVALRETDDLTRAIDTYADHVDGLLLDAAIGGSGKRFDWMLAENARALLPAQVRLIVAGGLTPANVAQAVAVLRPDVVDVASGVENAVGQKSAEKINAFVREAGR